MNITNKFSKKTSVFLFAFILLCTVYTGFISYGVYLDSDFSKKSDWLIPFDDTEARYQVTCDNEWYTLKYINPSHEKNGSQIFISESPRDLEEFCNQFVKVSITPEKKVGLPLCTPSFKNENEESCRTTKARVHRIDSLVLE